MFCTYTIRQGGTLKVLEKELTQKGYATILCLPKRGLKLDKTDFSDVLEEISKVLEEYTTA